MNYKKTLKTCLKLETKLNYNPWQIKLTLCYQKLIGLNQGSIDRFLIELSTQPLILVQFIKPLTQLSKPKNSDFLFWFNDLQTFKF